jgi:hypothetical protein
VLALGFAVSLVPISHPHAETHPSPTLDRLERDAQSHYDRCEFAQAKDVYTDLMNRRDVPRVRRDVYVLATYMCLWHLRKTHRGYEKDMRDLEKKYASSHVGKVMSDVESEGLPACTIDQTMPTANQTDSPPAWTIPTAIVLSGLALGSAAFAWHEHSESSQIESDLNRLPPGGLADGGEVAGKLRSGESSQTWAIVGAASAALLATTATVLFVYRLTTRQKNARLRIGIAVPCPGGICVSF